MRASSRLLARFLLVAGALLIGWFLVRGGPKDVVLVYDLGGTAATALDVDVRRDGASARHAEFRFAHGAPAQVRHEVKLPEGDYTLAFTVRRPGGDLQGERALSVVEDGTIVVSLAR